MSELPAETLVSMVPRNVPCADRYTTMASTLGDAVDSNDKPFSTQFPYVPTPWSGSEVNTGTQYRYLHTPPLP